MRQNRRPSWVPAGSALVPGGSLESGAYTRAVSLSAGEDRLPYSYQPVTGCELHPRARVPSLPYNSMGEAPVGRGCVLGEGSGFELLEANAHSPWGTGVLLS